MGAPPENRPLSKSQFKTGLECPRKLAYARERYPSAAKEDPYLKYLAEGGFMVEAIARALFPSGQEVHPLGHETPAQATQRLLMSAGEVDLFEAVFEHDGCSARVDILSRRGDTIDLIEIKAKSFKSVKDVPSPFRGKRGGIDGDWLPYLQDVAFQTTVVRGAVSRKFRVVPKLCLVDTARTCGDAATYNRIELLPESDVSFGMPRARYLGDPSALKHDHFLSFEDVSGEVEELLADVKDDGVEPTRTRLAKAAHDGSLRQLPIELGTHCRKCEYRHAVADGDQRNGFRECWGPLADLEPHVLDLYRVDLLAGRDGKRLQSLLKKGIAGIRDIPSSAIDSESDIAARQRVQVQAVREGREWRGPGLQPALAELRMPFHFVDFETSRMAAPFHAGMPPYGQVAFQFSCHTLESAASTKLVHKEWINPQDAWPNVEFAQALREAIGDSGQMLVWSHHERSVLRDIAADIRTFGKGPKDLADWLEPLTRPYDEGGRMVDLYDICRRHYYHPAMGGKTSIKAVLKAVWQENRSLHDHPWFQGYLLEKDGKVLSPYETLPAVDLGGGESRTVRDGTGAMRAYSDMVYGLRKNDERYRMACRDVLLRYCKLDTLAMVMVWVHWNRVSQSSTP